MAKVGINSSNGWAKLQRALAHTAPRALQNTHRMRLLIQRQTQKGR